jgi:phosphatidylethanolamine-binding protein (PEBP) family uncharacterized protein
MRSFWLPLVIALVPTTLAAQPQARPTLDVTSSAFANNGAIPSDYTCDGGGMSPPLSWSKAPEGTKSIAVLVEDPDAPHGTFTHWLVTGIAPTATSLPRGAAGYTGPCPPSGRHHYLFRVFALDTTPASGLSRPQFLTAINGHVLATGQLVGTYQRK